MYSLVWVLQGGEMGGCQHQEDSTRVSPATHWHLSWGFGGTYQHYMWLDARHRRLRSLQRHQVPAAMVHGGPSLQLLCIDHKHAFSML